MAEEKEKIKSKKEELEKKAKEKELNELKEKRNEIINLKKKIDEHRDRLWGKLESLMKDLQEYKEILEKGKNSLEQKKELSKSDKESIKKIKHRISFLNRFIKFYVTELKPGLRNWEGFRFLFFDTYGIIKTKNKFRLLEKPLKIILDLKLGSDINGMIDIIKKDIEILPHLMESYLKLQEKFRIMWKKLSESK